VTFEFTLPVEAAARAVVTPAAVAKMREAGREPGDCADTQEHHQKSSSHVLAPGVQQPA
jgi:hypothetical protein